MSVDALSTAEHRLGDERGMIGNSLQLMSNPNLTFPKTPLTIGANQGSDTVRGGATQLPDSVQQLLNAHWRPLSRLLCELTMEVQRRGNRLASEH